MTSPLKFHGSKGKLAKWIIGHFPADYITYVEPYFGGGSVMLACDHEGKAEVVNDISGRLIRFWRVLQNPTYFEEFKRRCEATPFCEAMFDDAEVRATQEFLGTEYESPVVQIAHNFFIQSRQSLAGRMKSFAPITKRRLRRGMNEQVSAWLTAVEGLPEVHQRLHKVLILNRNAIGVIDMMDGKDSFFYLDPPYLAETRSAQKVYEHEMDEGQHRTLLAHLVSIGGKFLLSGYRSDLYDEYAAINNWRRVDLDVKLHSAGGAEKATKTECLWMNY